MYHINDKEKNWLNHLNLLYATIGKTIAIIILVRWTNGTNIAYTNIPKRATNQAVSKVQKNYITDDLSNYRFFVALRDPYSRWLSGVVEWLTRYGIVNIEDTDVFGRHEFVRFLLNAKALDSHTEHQVHYIAGIDRTKIDFLLVDKDYSQTLWKYCSEMGIPLYNIKQIGTANVSALHKKCPKNCMK